MKLLFEIVDLLWCDVYTLYLFYHYYLYEFLKYTVSIVKYVKHTFCIFVFPLSSATKTLLYTLCKDFLNI